MEENLFVIAETFMRTFWNKIGKYMTVVKKLMIKILNLKLVILLEYQNIKIFLQKIKLQIGLRKFL